MPVRFEPSDALTKYEGYQSLDLYLKQRRVVEATFWGTIEQTVVPHGQNYLSFSLQLVRVEIAR